MISYPQPEPVIDGLGEKAVGLLVDSVGGARADWQNYRSAFPDFAAEASARGVANWIHDRMWHHLSTMSDGLDDVSLNEAGVLREVTFGLNFRLRLKRHSGDGSVSTYRTATALEFYEQPAAALPGLELLRLAAGYLWIDESYDVGPAVLSLRDGLDNLVWMHELGEADHDTSGVTPVRPPVDGPTPPAILTPGLVAARQREDEAT